MGQLVLATVFVKISRIGRSSQCLPLCAVRKRRVARRHRGLQLIDQEISLAFGVDYWVPPQNHDFSRCFLQKLGLIRLQIPADAQVMGGYGQHPRSEAALVPQMSQQQYARLTSSQQAELELARRRAQKAAEGKRANATAARLETHEQPESVTNLFSSLELILGTHRKHYPPEYVLQFAGAICSILL